ncbi:hypothetical protein RFI_27961 [Reticulomyxa filosa]|uniref:Uncharacterized protein n=1 Tax=Reticulomyxa filosa TaxID=46433 RepID=X6M7J8_RETFI|nr:hypothetical protein RFI_27961 [Reticulomyxa filosa]|eukprot:ETO09417.1 hypothetical protein RFI_27961 [Reticulomyxa filosa]
MDAAGEKMQHGFNQTKRIVRGKRGLHRVPTDETNPNKLQLSPRLNDTTSLSTSHDTSQNISPMIRKRKFDEMSAGSLELAQWLRESPLLRIPYHALLYVRVSKPITSQNLNKTDNLQDNIQSNSEQKEIACEKKEDTSMDDNVHDNDQENIDWMMNDQKTNWGDESDVSMSEHKRIQGVTDTWVKVFPSSKVAASVDWVYANPLGRVHEYQLLVI